MQPIPQPHILDPDRLLDNDRGDLTADHKARADLLDDALHESCAYARQLWERLDGVRNYLWRSLPSDPRGPGPHRMGATPTGPDDDRGWEDWVASFAGVASVLCGSHGDSGFGLQEARRAAQLRRDAPNLLLESERGPVSPSRSGGAVPDVTAPRSAARTAALAVLALLAIRGLLPRRGVENRR